MSSMTQSVHVDRGPMAQRRADTVISVRGWSGSAIQHHICCLLADHDRRCIVDGQRRGERAVRLCCHPPSPSLPGRRLLRRAALCPTRKIHHAPVTPPGRQVGDGMTPPQRPRRRPTLGVAPLAPCHLPQRVIRSREKRFRRSGFLAPPERAQQRWSARFWLRRHATMARPLNSSMGHPKLTNVTK